MKSMPPLGLAKGHTIYEKFSLVIAMLIDSLSNHTLFLTHMFFVLKYLFKKSQK